MTDRILILGAGPTGLGAAYRLHEKGYRDVVIHDRNPFVGGLAASHRDEQGFVWDFAVHVAHSHYRYVDTLMDRLLPDGFFHHERRSWVRLYDRFIPYPFQNNIRHLPESCREECVQGLRAIRGHSRAGLVDFESWIHAVFGAGIARHFMLPYNRKIWCLPPSEMGCQWMGDRVPVVDLERVERNIALGVDDVSWGPNHTFQFPKRGGTGAIWRALADALPAGWLRLQSDLVRLDPAARVAWFSDGSRQAYDPLISTIPLVRLAELTGDAALISRARGLRYTRVAVLGVAVNRPLPDPLRDKTWIYTPESKCRFYRVTPFSLFSPDHVPEPDRQCSLLCEVAVADTAPRGPADLAAETLDGLRAIGLIDLAPGEARVHELTAEFGYPVPTLDRDAILADVLPALERNRIYSRGRFGGWKYEVANMDHSVMQGVEVVDRILDGAEEVTLPFPHIVNAGKR